MNSAKPCPTFSFIRRRLTHLSIASFLAGLVVALLMVRALPPAPVFSPQLARATYWQSYETSYFATVRAYEAPIAAFLSEGLIPVVVFGDSCIRGTGAAGDEVWTRVLERRLQAVEPRARVINFAQNAGDLMGPFLYHHLQRKFPNAYYIVQWHFPSEIGVRHPFHFWLTSEIALRDGNINPAVKHAYTAVPIWTIQFPTFGLADLGKEEHYAFVFAALNIASNYLDAGNWIRYLLLGHPFFDADRKVKIQPLRDVAESDTSIRTFTPPAADSAKMMREIFFNQSAEEALYLQQPLEERTAYFAETFPSLLRSRLLLLTTDYNPYYAPPNNKEITTYHQCQPLNHKGKWQEWAEHVTYLAELLPLSLRKYLLLLATDYNPYPKPSYNQEKIKNNSCYPPLNNEEKLQEWSTNWVKLRKDMATITDLRWLSITASNGEMQVDDFMDLGHMTPQGQQKLANAVADNLLAPGGWFARIKDAKQ